MSNPKKKSKTHYYFKELCAITELCNIGMEFDVSIGALVAENKFRPKESWRFSIEAIKNYLESRAKKDPNVRKNQNNFLVR